MRWGLEVENNCWSRSDSWVEKWVYCGNRLDLARVGEVLDSNIVSIIKLGEVIESKNDSEIVVS